MCGTVVRDDGDQEDVRRGAEQGDFRELDEGADGACPGGGGGAGGDRLCQGYPDGEIRRGREEGGKGARG